MMGQVGMKLLRSESAPSELSGAMTGETETMEKCFKNTDFGEGHVLEKMMSSLLGGCVWCASCRQLLEASWKFWPRIQTKFWVALLVVISVLKTNINSALCTGP